MIREFSVAVALAGLLIAGTARAGSIANCDAPFAYHSAVNVMLEDFERNAKADLRNTRRRLAWLVTLDTLFRDSYGSVGVHFLAQQEYDGHGPCTLDSVVERVASVVPADGATVFFDQRVYQEVEQILVQSYLRFTRFNDVRQRMEEVVNMGLGSDLPRFSEVLPEQRLAFPPRQLTTETSQRSMRGLKWLLVFIRGLL